MNHLTAEILNMYLDGALDPDERAAADAHLAGCRACQGELAALRELFATIEALPPEQLPADLTAQVLGRIAGAAEPRIAQQLPDRESILFEPFSSLRFWFSLRAWARLRERPGFIAALLVQVVLATALAAWLAPQLVDASSAALRALSPPMQSDLAPMLAGINSWLAVASGALFELTRASDTLSAGPFGDFSAAQWAMLLAAVGLVWFFGNRFLLAGSPERRGNHQEAA